MPPSPELSNGYPAQPGTGGTVHLGLSSGMPATLTLTGTYAQTASGTLYVEVTPFSNGLLQLVANGGTGGNATIAGNVTFHRAPNSQPGTGAKTFISAPGGINGAFGTWGSDPANDSWMVGMQVVGFQAPTIAGTLYQLNIS